MGRSNKNSSYMAKGGLLTALGVMFVYLSGIVPINKGYLLAIASCIIPLSVVMTNVKNSIVVYIATSMLSVLISGMRITVIAYILFFGLYGLAKYYIENLRKLPIEIILKLIFFNISLGVLFLVYKLFFPNLLKINMPFYLLIVAAQIAFILYDYILTLFIDYINKYLHKRMEL